MNRQISQTISKTLIAAVAVIALGVSAETVSANEYNHINRMAVKIRNQTRTLLRETEHYRYTANYRHLVGDSAALRQLAEQTREIARAEGCLDTLAGYVVEMHETFHHLEDLFDNTELLAAHCHGSVKGHTAHVKRLLESIDECICHMQDDIAVLRAAIVIAPPVVVQRPVIAAATLREPVYPYGNRSQRPIVVQVDTYRVPARPSRGSGCAYGGRGLSDGYGPKYGHRPSPRYGSGYGGYGLHSGRGSSPRHFNF